MTQLPLRMSDEGRLHYLDNIRWSMIVLVLLVHSAVTYGPIGSWFYHDVVEMGTLSEIVLIIVPVFSQTFFMGLLFLVAGYFLPSSLDRKGSRQFMIDRAIRLGAPTLLFMLIIAPLIFLLIYGGSVLSYLPSYWANPLDWDSGPLWFAIALLGFSAAYVGWAQLRGEPAFFRSLPSNRAILSLVIVIIVATIIVRVFFPIGTSVWNMQLCFFPQYIALFLLGIGAGKGAWLSELGWETAWPWSIIALFMGVIAFPAIFVIGGAMEGGFDVFAGGLSWQAISLATIEQFSGVGLALLLLVWFKEGRNVRTKADAFLSDHSFAVYVLHAPVLVGIAVLLAPTEIPVLLRFVIVFAVGLTITLGLAWASKKIPGLRRIL